MSITRLTLEKVSIFEARVVAKKYKGNLSSLSVTIPIEIAQKTGIEKGDLVKLALISFQKAPTEISNEGESEISSETPYETTNSETIGEEG